MNIQGGPEGHEEAQSDIVKSEGLHHFQGSFNHNNLGDSSIVVRLE